MKRLRSLLVSLLVLLRQIDAQDGLFVLGMVALWVGLSAVASWGVATTTLGAVALGIWFGTLALAARRPPDGRR